MIRFLYYLCFWITVCGIVYCQTLDSENSVTAKRPITLYRRQSIGPIAISEASPEGHFICLENISFGSEKKDVKLGGWILRRRVDGKQDYTYNFRDFTLRAGARVKIYANGSASAAGMNDLILREEDNWGVGSKVNTTLINDKGAEMARYIQTIL
ncbi:Lamin Tail Domain [Mactra antiquata]